MITRKRLRSQTREGPERTAKKTRQTLNSQATLKSSISDRSSQNNSSTSSYPIKAIIAERPGEFLVDWEDNAATGHQYSPSWQPKKNVSKQAIADWREIIGQARHFTTAPIHPQHPKRSWRLRSHKVVDSSSNEDPTDRNLPVTQLQSQQSNAGNFVVRITQHSSLEKDQYASYHSSVPTRSILSSLPPHQDSGLSHSSPSSNSSVEQDKSTKPSIIPDSQSLPGSSSYVPSSNSSGEATEGYIEDSLFTLSDSADFRYTRDRPASLATDEEEIQPQENSGFYVAQSPEYAERFRRSRSAPVESQLQYSKSSRACKRQQSVFSRSHSDPIPLILSVEQEEDFSAEASRRAETSASILSQTLTAHLRSPVTGVAPRNPARSQPRKEPSTGFVILEDTVPDSQPTQTTGGFGLNERHPNSQSSKSEHIVDHSSEQASQKSSSLLTLSSNLIEPVTSHQISELLDSTTALLGPLPASIPSTMSQPSVTSASTQVRAPSEFPSANLREKLKNLRAGSRRKADESKQNKRRLDQGQYPSLSNELAVRSNLSETVESPTVSATPEHGAATKIPESSVQRETAQVPLHSPKSPRTSLPGPVPFSAASSGAPAAESVSDNARRQTAEELGQEQSRLEAQPLKVSTHVPLPLHIPRGDLRSSTANDPPIQPEEFSSLSQVVTPMHPHVGKMEFIVPLSMSSRVRDQYLSIINHYGRSIEESQCQRISKDALSQTEKMLNRLDRVTTHVDLDDGMNLTQEDAASEDLALWAENCSEKFRFLRHLFDALSDHNLHLAVVARPGMTLEITETFLKGRHVAYNRPDTFSRSDPAQVRGRIEVTLLPSGAEGSSSVPSAASLVIALDGSFTSQDEQVLKLRQHLTQVDRLAPVLHLLVYNSAEHIARCISTNLDPVNRIRRIVSCLTQNGDEVGRLHLDELSPPAAAEEVAAFVTTGTPEDAWPVPSIRPIEGVVAIEYSQDPEVFSGPGTQTSTRQKVVAPSAALKRALEFYDGSPAQGKRQRMTPVPDVTQVSDSMTQESQTIIAELRTALQEANAKMAARDTSHIRREAELQASVEKSNLHVRELTRSLKELQDRYEKRGQDNAVLREERNALTAAATASEKKREANAAEIAYLKQSHAKLADDLTRAQMMLMGSTLPGVADLERANSEIRRLRLENEGCARKIASMERDFGFMREQYQAASNAAAESALENRTLQSDAELLRAKASENVVRLHEINRQNENDALAAHISRLQATLADREELVRRKEEEIKQYQRGRGMGTRGSSVLPGGSPRGSRGASPVGGEPMLKMGSKGLGSNLRFGARLGTTRGEDDA